MEDTRGLFVDGETIDRDLGLLAGVAAGGERRAPKLNIRKFRKYNHLFSTYRAAKRGDIQAARFLLGLALMRLKEGKPVPPGLHRYFVSIVQDPNLYHKIMTHENKLKRSRGRPSANTKPRKFDYGIRSPFKSNQYSAAEEYAMVMIYLVSLGHPIDSHVDNVKSKMKSATVILSELTGRSARALQYDYYHHRRTLLKDGYVLERGEIELARLKNISEYKKESRRLGATRRYKNS